MKVAFSNVSSYVNAKQAKIPQRETATQTRKQKDEKACAVAAPLSTSCQLNS